MNKKNIKLLMELIFIFILPFIFICFTSTIGKTYQYDNEGNFETSEIELSFDNSIIKYTKNPLYTNYLKVNQLFESDTPITIHQDQSFYKWANVIIGHKYFIYVQTNCTSGYIQIWESEERVNAWSISSNNVSKGQLQANSINYLFFDITTYQYLCARNSINSGIANTIWQPMLIDLTEMFGSGYEPTTYNELQQYINLPNYINYNTGYIINYKSNNIISSNYDINYTIWGNIKQLITNTLDLNDNILLDIIICYTAMWLIMWLLWHLLYGFFELLWHVIPRRE